MTTPDDELLALARKAQKIIPGAWERDSIETDGHYGNGPHVSEGFDEFGIYADGDLLFDSTNTDRAEIEVEYDEDTKQAWNEVSRVIFGYIAAANPAAIIAMIERHRAEVERLTRERDAWELTSRTSSAAAKVYEDVAQGKNLDPSIVLDAANRLNEVRNYAPPCVTRHEMEQALELIRDAMIANMSRAEAAESALAAAQKRVGELEKAGRAVFEYFFGSIVCRPSRDPDMEYELLSELRAALAGPKESDNG